MFFTHAFQHPILHSGIGRGGTFQEPLVLADIIEKVKRLVGKDKIRVAYAHKKGTVYANTFFFLVYTDELITLFSH